MNPFVGQIQPFGFNFAPRGWSFCNGGILDIASHTALFSLLGTTYGGDGRTTFQLPDLRGRVHFSEGMGPGLPSYSWGGTGGTDYQTLSASQLPSHSHVVRIPATSNDANIDDPSNAVFAVAEESVYATSPSGSNALKPFSTGSAGGGQSYSVSMPSLAVNFCIALVGTYPSRS